MNGWWAVFALTAAALVAFTAWALHRARRIVEKGRYRPPQHWEDQPP